MENIMKLKKIYNSILFESESQSEPSDNESKNPIALAVLLSQVPKYKSPPQSELSQRLGKLFGITDLIEYGKLNLSDINNEILKNTISNILYDIEKNTELQKILKVIKSNQKTIEKLSYQSELLARKALTSVGINKYYDEYYFWDKIKRLIKDYPQNKEVLEYLELEKEKQIIIDQTQNLIKTDMYPLIKTIITSDKYSSFEEMILNQYDDLTTDELKSLKYKYLKTVLDRSKIMVQNILSPIKDRQEKSALKRFIKQMVFPPKPLYPSFTKKDLEKIKKSDQNWSQTLFA
jgi:hypothetical protein